jgi:DNA-binding transcriptional LysR family regulator
METLYEEQINFIARPDHPLVTQNMLSWDDILAYPWIVWPRGTPIRNAIHEALIAAGKTLPAHFVESNSSLSNLTLLNNSNLIGVASHRAALRFENLNAIRILNMQLNTYGSVSMYWHGPALARAAVQLALQSLRESAQRVIEGWRQP